MRGRRLPAGTVLVLISVLSGAVVGGRGVVATPVGAHTPRVQLAGDPILPPPVRFTQPRNHEWG